MLPRLAPRARRLFTRAVSAHGGHGHSRAPTPAAAAAEGGPGPGAAPDRAGGAHLGVGRSTAVVAIGSNQGDRVELFRAALRALADAGVVVQRHSCLYETAPAYVTDQPAFLNAAMVVRVDDPATAADPVKLLDILKRVERDLGRAEGGRRFGPRPTDLDIIFHERGVHRCARLEVPHPRYAERGFVLAPLADLHTGAGIAGGDSFNVAAGLTTALKLWRQSGGEARVALGASGGGGGGGGGGDEDEDETIPVDAIRRVVPLGNALWSWGHRTMIMGILNATPDSFSDGGALLSRDDADADADADSDSTESGDGASPRVDVARAVAAARRLVSSGADFVDVGGQSTRPGATRVSPEAEAARVVPVIRAVAAALAEDAKASSKRASRAFVSVDTFYGSVASAAARAGADVINDVSAGTLDAGMLAAVAATERPTPYVAMHMRGDPTTMQSAALTRYDDVSRRVGEELAARAAAASAAGVEPWRLWTDPGLGFAKTHEGCWDLLANLRGVRDAVTREGGGGLARAPMLVGASRKGFLGAATGKAAASARDPATAAACVAGVLAGADVVRVHDVDAVVDAVRVADAVARHGGRAEAAARARRAREYAWLVKPNDS
jgi:2-amino-4-hydroxy-6-hydroxymethyldihydropteridine diphosphokinase/dihydropteroate synthase